MKKFFLAICISAAVFFAACGDSDSSNSANDDSGNSVSSSSIAKDDSSSSEEESSSSDDPGSVYDSTANTLTDLRDGQVYRTVKLGSQIWMAENLNFETREGKSRCYDNDSLNCKKYGRLYTWAALMDTLTTRYGYYKVGHTNRGVCPLDWHVPTNKEWETMITKFNYKSNGALLADASEWDEKDSTEVFTDEFGFSALPAGQWDATGSLKQYKDLREYVYFWTQTEYAKEGEREKGRQAYMVFTQAGTPQLYLDYHTYKSNGLSVRCIKD